MEIKSAGQDGFPAEVFADTKEKILSDRILTDKPQRTANTK